MTLYTSSTVQHFDGDYVIAVLLNQAYDLRRSAQICSNEKEAQRLLNQAQELETAASLLHLCRAKIWDAYQAIGRLSSAAGLFGDDGVIRAMDYMSDELDTMDNDYCFSIANPTLRIRITGWWNSRWNKLRRGLERRTFIWTHRRSFRRRTRHR